jgi:hypothetical protein
LSKATSLAIAKAYAVLFLCMQRTLVKAACNASPENQSPESMRGNMHFFIQMLGVQALESVLPVQAILQICVAKE